MSRRSLFAVAFLFALAISVLPLGKLVMAQVSPHVTQALDHAKEAVEQGNMGHASVVVEHAEESMKHLKMAQAEGENPHLTAAAKGLEEAIEQGNMGHAELATKGAAEAVRHLEMIE